MRETGKLQCVSELLGLSMRVILNMRKMKKHPKEFFFTDAQRMPNILDVIKFLPENVGIVFRHYNHPERTALAKTISKLCNDQNRTLLIGKDINLAKRLNSGLHIPEYLLNSISNIDISGLPFVTCSAHNLSALKKAQSLNLSAAFLSPLFKTKTHEGEKGLGLINFLVKAGFTKMPIYALGGISYFNKPSIPKNKNILGIGGIRLFLKIRS